MGRKSGLLAVIAVLGLVGAACDDSTDKAGASELFSLETGECFDSDAATEGRTVELDGVTPVPCTGAHDGEVFGVATHPAAEDTAYPGDDAVADFAAAECLQQFPGYTGTAYDNSDLQVASVRPDADSWADKDDRAVACVLYKQGETLTGSQKKA